MNRLIILSAMIWLSVPQITKAQIDAKTSKVFWNGTKLAGTGSHHGTLDFLSINVQLRNGRPVSGTFTIDMKSLKVTDIPPQETVPLNALTTHLTEEFQVRKYPSGTFTITAATEKQLTGKLTIMGRTATISFPYSTTNTDFQATFSISRNQWGIGDKANWLEKKLVDDLIQIKIVLAK